jgi:hypothetical protein
VCFFVVVWVFYIFGKKLLNHFTPTRMCTFKKAESSAVKDVRMWRNWNTCALLVGMQDGAAAMENSMVVP